jgi:hypothetical protein
LAVKKATAMDDVMEQRTFLRAHIERTRAKTISMDGAFLDRPVVSIKEFIEGEKYLNASGRVWPIVMEYLEELNKGTYTEAVLTGAIGCAKTTMALYTQAYQLYILSCYTQPHQPFDLDPTSEIEIVFQSLNRQLAADVDYERFRAILEESPYFTKTFPFDPKIKSKLMFPKRIVVRPITGEATAAIGQNVIGGVIDEINFMAIIEKSKKNPDGDTYDQALDNYNTIARRRESRFMKAGGFLPGMLCVVSSARFRGQFTDQKKEEAKTNKRIFVYDKRVWEVCPPGRFAGEMFEVFPGDDLRKPYFVDEDTEVPQRDMSRLIKIPIEYMNSFRSDIMNSLRDIAGMATTAVHPFIMEPEKVADCFDKHRSIFSRDDVDFLDSQVSIICEHIQWPYEPRFIHIDLALNRDSCGFAVGCVPKFTDIIRGDEVESLPVVHIDGILEIKAPKGGEIQFADVRRVVYALERAGIPIRWVTFDRWQSRDSIQELQRHGLECGECSVDKTTQPYDVLKQTMYDARMESPRHLKCLTELVQLERDVTKNKIDHRPDGSKDCSDALAGMVFGVSRRRDTWVRHGIPLYKVPAALRRQKGTSKDAASV